MIAINTIQPASDGWFIEWDDNSQKHGHGYVHLTAEWLDEMWRHQIKPRRAHDSESGRDIPAEGEAAFNRLRYLIVTGSEDADLVAETFAEAYRAIVGNRIARQGLGLKAVTKDGDEDLRAVQTGAPVRRWNAVNDKKELHEFIASRRRGNPPEDRSARGKTEPAERPQS